MQRSGVSDAAAAAVAFAIATFFLVSTANADAPDKPSAPGPAGLSVDDFLAAQKAAAPMRDEQLKVLKVLIASTPVDHPDLPDLYFRLAEGQASKQRFYRLQAAELYQSISAQKNQARKNRLVAEQKRLFAKEREWLVKAVANYTKLVAGDRFKNYARMDQAIFFLGHTLRHAKREEAAKKVFHRLIRQHPGSRYVVHAYLIFADSAFREDRLKAANNFYDKVLQFPDTSVYDYALYMKGWVLYNQARFDKSLAVWLKVAQRTRGKRVALYRAARKDFVRAYAEVGRADLAHKAFLRVDKNYAKKMLAQLGAYYLSQGKVDQTVFVFRSLIKLSPKDPAVCEWQAVVVQAVRSRGADANQAKQKEIVRLARLFSHLQARGQLKPNLLRACKTSAEGAVRRQAKLWHREGIKTENIATMERAQKLYDQYRRIFVAEQAGAEMMYHRGDLLWERAEREKNAARTADRWERTALAFEQVLADKRTSSTRRKKAVRAMVIAWKNAVAAQPDETSTVVQAGKGPQPLSAREKKKLAAFRLYLKHVNDKSDDERTQIEFSIAATWRRHQHHKKAVPLFRSLVTQHPAHPSAEHAARGLVESLTELGHYQAMDQAVRAMLRNRKLVDNRPQLQADLTKRKWENVYRIAIYLEKRGDYLGCAHRYEDILRGYQANPDEPSVLFNAAVCYEKAKLIGRAIFWRTVLIKRYPNHPKAKKSQYAVGYNFAQIARYGQAAENYERYAKRFSGEKNAADAINDAVFFTKGLGDDNKAVELTDYYVRKFGKKRPKEAAMASFSLVDIYHKQGQPERAVRHLRGYLKRWKKVGGIDREIIAHARIGQLLWKLSCPVKTSNEGACVSLRRPRALKVKRTTRSRAQTPKHCSPPTVITVHDRDRRLLKEAHRHLAIVHRLWEKGAVVKKIGAQDEVERRARLRELIRWVAAAQFQRGEEHYERFLQLQFPRGLNFDKRRPKLARESLRRFNDWRKQKEAALAKAADAYMIIKDEIGFTGGQDYVIAAAARSAQLFQNYADAFFAAPIPKDVRTGPYAQLAIPAYCDKLIDPIEPLHRRAVANYSTCLSESSKRGWFNRWSRMCEAQLGQLGHIATGDEIRAAPGNQRTLVSRSGFQPTLFGRH